MTIDIGAMLDRVVSEVFGDSYQSELIPNDKDPWIHMYLISSLGENQRSVRIRATYEWFEAVVPDLDVGSMLFEYDDVESEKAKELTRLCDAMKHYLDGEGQVTQRKTLIRRRLENVLTLNVDGREWVLGRHHSSSPYPD